MSRRVRDPSICSRGTSPVRRTVRPSRLISSNTRTIAAHSHQPNQVQSTRTTVNHDQPSIVRPVVPVDHLVTLDSDWTHALPNASTHIDTSTMMSIASDTPAWIQELCCDSYLRLNRAYDPETQLNELSTFLESDQSNRIDTIAFYQHQISNSTMDGVFKGLRTNSKIRTLVIIVTSQLPLSECLGIVRTQLNRMPPSIALALEFSDEAVIQPWIHALRWNTKVTSLRFQRSRFSPSDIKELVELLGSNYTITQLSFTLSAHGMSPNDLAPLWNCLKSDHFIKSLSVDYVDWSVGDVTALADALKVNNTITSIELKGSLIHSSARAVFAKALNSNTTLTSIHLPDLQSKGRGAEGQKLLSDRLQRNCSFIHNPLTVLLRQTEVAKEVERRQLVQQMRWDNSTRSLGKEHHPPDEAKDEGHPTKTKFELTSSSVVVPAGVMVPSSPVMVRLSEYEVEYLRVNLDFHQSLVALPQHDGLKFNVTQIERVTNLLLQEQFDQSYQYFMTHNYHSIRPIRSVYHSTKPENIPNIIRSNLSLSKAGSVTGKGQWGMGMYFSPHADYTFVFWSTGQLRHVGAGDRGKILQFDILPGRMLHMKDVTIGAARTPHYDSHVSPNEFEHVMFDSRHILPRYVISFEVIPGMRFQRPPALLTPRDRVIRVLCGLLFVLLLYWLIRSYMKNTCGDDSLGHEPSTTHAHNLTCPLPDTLNGSKNVNSFVNQILSLLYLS